MRTAVTAATEQADGQHHFEEDAVLRSNSPTIPALQAAIEGLATRLADGARGDAALDLAERLLRSNGLDLRSLPYSSAIATATNGQSGAAGSLSAARSKSIRRAFEPFMAGSGG